MTRRKIPTESERIFAEVRSHSSAWIGPDGRFPFPRRTPENLELARRAREDLADRDRRKAELDEAAIQRLNLDSDALQQFLALIRTGEAQDSG